jgi:large subunit ribosomal protein L30
MNIAMAKIKVTLFKSKSGASERQKRNLQALGLGKTNSSVEIETSPAILGMVRKVEHMVCVEKL